MREAIPPLPHTPSWRGAQVKNSTGTILPYKYPFATLSAEMKEGHNKEICHSEFVWTG
jgi:hypothetical protein